MKLYRWKKNRLLSSIKGLRTYLDARNKGLDSRGKRKLELRVRLILIKIERKGEPNGSNPAVRSHKQYIYLNC